MRNTIQNRVTHMWHPADPLRNWRCEYIYSFHQVTGAARNAFSAEKGGDVKRNWANLLQCKRFASVYLLLLPNDGGSVHRTVSESWVIKLAFGRQREAGRGHVKWSDRGHSAAVETYGRVSDDRCGGGNLYTTGWSWVLIEIGRSRTRWDECAPMPLDRHT
jgi:hypothetical protein